MREQRAELFIDSEIWLCTRPLPSFGQRQSNSQGWVSLFPISTDFLKVPYFFPAWLCHFKGLFFPIWGEINQSKIPPVKSWQVTNRRVSSIWRHSRQSMWIYIMIQIQSGEATSSLARSLAARHHWSSFRSLLTTHERSTICRKEERL